MEDRDVEDLGRLLPPLLGALEALGFVARYLNPPDLPALLAAVGEPDAALSAARARIGDWSPALGPAGQALDAACERLLAALPGARASAIASRS